MRTLLAIALIGWSAWAGYTVVHAGYNFGFLLPLAGFFLIVGFTQEAAR